MLRTLAATVLLLVLASPFAAAQESPQRELYNFAIESEDTLKTLDVGGSTDFAVTFKDLSRDSSGGLSGGVGGAPNIGPSQHSVSFTYESTQADVTGWYVLTPTPLTSIGGQSFDLRVTVGASQRVANPYFPFTMTAVVQTSAGTFTASANFTALTLGLPSFNAQVGDVGGDIRPGQIVDIPVRITNGALFPRGFDVQVVENTCHLSAVASTNNLVGGKETKTYTVSVRGPTSSPWYFSSVCSLGIQVAPNDSPLATRVVTAPLTINGGYVNPQWVIWLVEILIVLLIIILFLVRRKARIEEEILGKPQKPWTIPVEALYLRALRQKDERAWYVVRHHLMEEEYRSSLLWYKAYKKATKGSRQKEALVLRQEKQYERWKAGWQKDIAKPLKAADKYEAKLQRKLDRKARKQDRKTARKVRSITRKMAAAHAKRLERALEKWQKQVRKAEKKGLEAPPRPQLPEPDYPEEPEPSTVLLADHKWAKKAARFRARRVKEQGNLEVRFEKADARRLAKLRRKVHRIARKLDDPDFVAEHPLLRAEA